MALPREVVSDGLLAAMADFEELLRGLDDDQWAAPSRCEGWTVGDVARHAVGSMADVLAGRLDGLGSDEVTAREVAERAGHSPAQLADECAEAVKGVAGLLPLFDDDAWAAGAPGGYHGSLGDGVEALWADFWFHTDDINAALGRPSVGGRSLPGARSHVAFELGNRGWSGEVPPVDDPDLVPFLLSATGRTPLRDGLVNIYA
jgi:uncharacterized protein (TIGR03083 family)